MLSIKYREQLRKMRKEEKRVKKNQRHDEGERGEQKAADSEVNRESQKSTLSEGWGPHAWEIIIEANSTAQECVTIGNLV